MLHLQHGSKFLSKCAGPLSNCAAQTVVTVFKYKRTFSSSAAATALAAKNVKMLASPQLTTHNSMIDRRIPILKLILFWDISRCQLSMQFSADILNTNTFLLTHKLWNRFVFSSWIQHILAICSDLIILYNIILFILYYKYYTSIRIYTRIHVTNEFIFLKK